jgi:riboflavin synthase
MFTGLVQTLGRVAETADDGHGGRVLVVRDADLAPSLTLGESVAVNGVCLTVVRHDAAAFAFQVGPETLLRTTLGTVRPGDGVNLERALRVGDRLGGHFVTGHVDCVGTVANRAPSGEWDDVTFAIPPEFDELLVPKGSVAVDGVSLTVAGTAPGSFRVMLIPHTLAVTTLGSRAVGSAVNLEFDLLAKHVRQLIRSAR